MVHFKYFSSNFDLCMVFKLCCLGFSLAGTAVPQNSYAFLCITICWALTNKYGFIDQIQKLIYSIKVQFNTVWAPLYSVSQDIEHVNKIVQYSVNNNS